MDNKNKGRKIGSRGKRIEEIILKFVKVVETTKDKKECTPKTK